MQEKNIYHLNAIEPHLIRFAWFALRLVFRNEHHQLENDALRDNRSERKKYA